MAHQLASGDSIAFKMKLHEAAAISMRLANVDIFTPSCESRGAFVVLCPHPWGELFGKSLRLQRLGAELKVLRYDMVHAKM